MIAFSKLQMPNDAEASIQAAVNAASEHGKVGIVGYCFGGLLTCSPRASSTALRPPRHTTGAAWPDRRT